MKETELKDMMIRMYVFSRLEMELEEEEEPAEEEEPVEEVREQLSIEGESKVSI